MTVVGLYLDPPDRALVLCVDEKSQIQAFDRTQPLLAIDFGHPEKRTHDYVRHGTTTLFAALNVKIGEVIGQCQRRHRASEFKNFLDTIDASVPAELDVHLIVDNASTHKAPVIRNWRARHPRYQVHFTPTSSSWLTLIERFVAQLTQKQLRRGTHRSTITLERANRGYVDGHNENPRPFVWTKTADDILTSLGRFCSRTLNSGH